MRKPKWTLEQVFAHRDWLATDDNLQHETESDKDEYMFCIGHYFRPKGSPEEIAARAERARLESEWLTAECARAAQSILRMGEDAILRALGDPTLHSWVKIDLVRSHQYSRRVMDYILANPDSHSVWVLFWHPEFRISDLEMVIKNERYSPFLRSEAALHLNARSRSLSA